MKIILKPAIWLPLLLMPLLALLFFYIFPISSFWNESEVTKIYYADSMSPAHKALIEVFNRENKGSIEVIPVDLPFSKFTTNERKEILARTLRSRSDRIDILAVDLIWGPRFAKWSYPLDEIIDSKMLSIINEEALKFCYFNEKLIAVPLFFDIGLMYYRKDLIDQRPDADDIHNKIKYSITWDEFLKLSQKFKKRNAPFYIFAADNFEGMVCNFHEALSTEASDMIFGPDSVNLDTPQARAGLQMLVDFIHKYKITPIEVTELDETESYRYALENDAVFFRGWPGIHKQDFLEGADSDKIDNLIPVPLPRFRGFKTAGVYGGWNLMISKFSSNKSSAIHFLKFCLRKDIQILLFKTSGLIPVNKIVYTDSSLVAGNAELYYYKELLNLGKHRPLREDYTRISDIMSHYFHQALKKQLTVKEALVAASRRINSKQVIIK